MLIESEQTSSESPRHLVNEMTQLALSLIRDDGSVVICDEGDVTVTDPIESLDVNTLPAAFKREHLQFIALSIEGAIVYSTDTNHDLLAQYLAGRLAPYREHHDFVWHGARLVVVNREGYPMRVSAPSLAALEADVA